MNNIKLLLEKYFSGHTSQEEEALLQEYFTGGQVEDVYTHYIPLFEYIGKEKLIADKLQPTKAINKKWLYMVSGIAAAALLIWGIFLIPPSSDSQKSFVLIHGVYSEDPAQVHFYASQAIDRFFEASKPLFDCLAPFDVMINAYN